MNIRSLGYRTDLFFPSFDGEIIDRGDYLVIRSPTNPTYYWGNFLLFQDPPAEGSLKKWRELFGIEIGTPPEYKHLVFGWDSPDGDEGEIQPFIEAGFRIDHTAVLTSSKLHPPRKSSIDVSIRALKSDNDWEQAIENQVVCREEFEEGSYRKFKQQQMTRYRNMAELNLGDWYGAFIEDQLVADLGIFHKNGLGRFQSVETHPDFRRRGIAGTLVYESGQNAVTKYALDSLVIVADQDSNAERLYKSLGYHQTEHQVGVEWWPGMTKNRDDDN